MALKEAGQHLARRARGAVRRRLAERRLRAGAALRPGPRWVQVGIDDRCNYRCAMCRTHSYLATGPEPKHVLPRDVFDRVMRELRALGTQSVDVCGFGEPLLRPDALDMLRLIKGLGMECQLITNGSLLAPQVSEQLVDMGLDRLRISINSGRDETHHAITQAPLGERTRIMQEVRRILEYRQQRGLATPVVALTIAVQKENYRELGLLAREAAEMGLDNLEFLPLGINEASRDLALTPDEQAEVRRQVEEADVLLRSLGKTTTAADFLSRPPETYWTKELFDRIPCYVGQFFCRINANGDVNPCCPSVRVLGNVLERSFQEIWSSPAYRAFRREALALPERRSPVAECYCYNCYHHPFITEYYANLTAGRLQALF